MASIQTTAREFPFSRHAYRVRYKRATGPKVDPRCLCRGGRIKLVQAIQLKGFFSGLTPHFDVKKPKQLLFGTNMPGYVDAEGKGTAAYIVDAPDGKGRGHDWRITVCAVCETTLKGRVTGERILGCVNFTWYNGERSRGESYDETFVISGGPKFPGKGKSVSVGAKPPGNVWSKAAEAWKTIE